MDRDNITRTGARVPGVKRHWPLERWCASRTAPLDLERGYDAGSDAHEGRMQTARREELAVDGKAPPDILALKPDWGKPTVRKCVQERLECSVGGKPTEVKVRSLVAWIAERRKTEFLKPIDKAILRMVSKSSGRNESERRFGLEKRKPQGSSSLP
jgi:hypothetical protein